MAAVDQVAPKTEIKTVTIDEERAQLRKLISNFQTTLCGDAKAQTRVKAVNTLLNGGYNIKALDDSDLTKIWESIFFALWYAEMGRGCEEIIAAVDRACTANYRLTRIGFQTISEKWYGLDQYRVDKVSHLARHLLPILLHHQITSWFKCYKRNRELGSRDVPCKLLLKRTLLDVIKSYGLCYFLLEILAEELSKSLAIIYERYDMITGKFELKANLIVFLYKQIISFVTNVQIDSRLLRTFDQYVIKKFIEEILPNESQLTQILVTLRLYQNLDRHLKRPTRQLTGKCRALLQRWSSIIHDVHEQCLNGDFFPGSDLPVKNTIHLRPQMAKKLKKASLKKLRP